MAIDTSHRPGPSSGTHVVIAIDHQPRTGAPSNSPGFVEPMARPAGALPMPTSPRTKTSQTPTGSRPPRAGHPAHAARRLSTNAVLSDAVQEPGAGGKVQDTRPIDDAHRRSVEARRNAHGALPTDRIGAAQAAAELAAERARFLESLTPSARDALHTILSEGFAKGTASFLHFGLVQNYSGVMAQAVLDRYGATNPALRNLASAAMQAPLMAAAHYVGEMIVRPFMLALFGAALEKTDPDELVDGSGPEADARRDRLARQQKAPKMGEPIGDMLSLAGFMLAHATRMGTLGQTTPITTSAFSGLGGLLGVAGQTAAALNMRSGDGPAFHVTKLHWANAPAEAAQGFEASQRVTDDAGNIVRGHGRVGNVLQDLFVRGFGAFIGLMLKTAFTSIKPNDTTANKAFNGAMGSFTFLGMAYFASLGLLTLRGKVSRPGEATMRGIKALDPRQATGSTAAVLGPGRNPVFTRAVQSLDVVHHVAKTLQTLPVRAVAFDVAGPALTAGTGILRQAVAVGGGALPDVEALASRGLALVTRMGADHTGAPASRRAARFPAPFDADAIRRTLDKTPAARPETLHIRRPRGPTDASTGAATARQDRPKESVDLGTQIFWDSSDDEHPDESGDLTKDSGWFTSDGE